MSTNKLRIAAVAFALMTGFITGCGGGGGSNSSSTPTTPSASIKGVATPSSVSVVTAQNANAGG